LAVEVDWTRIGWSSLDKLDVIGSIDGLITSDVNEWSDASAYRLGLEEGIVMGGRDDYHQLAGKRHRSRPEKTQSHNYCKQFFHFFSPFMVMFLCFENFRLADIDREFHKIMTMSIF
jgi:hypothetical protein